MRYGVKLVIYGTGAMARVLYSYLRLDGLEVVAFTVDDHCIPDDRVEFGGLPLVPFSRVVERFDSATHEILVTVGYRDMNAMRARKCDEVRKMGFRLARYVHSSVLVHDDVVFGDNCMVLDQVSIHPGTRVGDGVFISSNVNIGHDGVLGDMCWINSGVAIAGGVRIGERTFIGVNATLSDGIEIGNDNFIGANTLVSRSTESGEVMLSPPGEKFRLDSHSFLRFCARSG